MYVLEHVFRGVRSNGGLTRIPNYPIITKLNQAKLIYFAICTPKFDVPVMTFIGEFENFEDNFSATRKTL